MSTNEKIEAIKQITQKTIEFNNTIVAALDDLGTKITGFSAYLIGMCQTYVIREEENESVRSEDEEDMMRDSYHGTKIKQRPDGRWYARYKIAPGFYKDIYGKTKIECVQKLKNFIFDPTTAALLKAPKKPRAKKAPKESSPIFRQFFRKWIETEKAPNISSVTYDHYLSNFRSWIDKDPLADMPMNAISTEYLREYIARIWSPTMRRRIYIMLGDIFRTAVEYSVIERSPMSGVKPPKKVFNERPAFLREEEDRFVELARQSEYWVIYALMLYEGLRSGEARALRPCDIKSDKIEVCRAMNDKGVIGTTKTGRKRYVPIFDQFKYIADKYRGDSTEPIFGSKVNKHLAQKEYLDIVKKLGLQHLNMYALRHTFATRCAEAEIIPSQISIWMGHSDVKTTMQYYVNISPDFERENVQKKDRNGK